MDDDNARTQLLVAVVVEVLPPFGTTVVVIMTEKKYKKNSISIGEFFKPQASESLYYAYKFCSFRLRRITEAGSWIRTLVSKT